jgi:acyl-CoA synthetase (AMP-forming)/AMP-acid ligase II
LSTVAETIADLAARYRESIAVQDESTRYTYHELDTLTDSVASGLLSQGTVAGDVIASLAPPTADFLIAYFAAAKAGLRILPLNPRLSLPELHAVMQLVRPAVVLAAPAYAELATELIDRRSVRRRYSLGPGGQDSVAAPLLALGREAARPPVVPPGPGTPHELLLTSGTTGQVKVVERTQGARLAECRMAVAHLGLSSLDHQLRLSPQFHMGGIIGPYQTLLAGGTATIGTFSPEMAAQGIGRGANFVAAVPTQYALVIESGALAQTSTDHVRLCSVGGSPSGAADIRRIRDAFPSADLLQIYGSTEAGLVAMNRGNDFLAHPDAVGFPLPGVEIAVVDEHGERVARGAVGELRVRSPFTMAGYHHDPELTAGVFTDGYLHTGDLVREDEDGRIQIAGRRSEMIITGGENVHPREVEDVLSRLPHVISAVVLGRPDPVYQERIAAVVTLDETGTGQLEAGLGEQLADAARYSLASYKIPREIYVAPEVPRNATGKIDRRALERQLESMVRIY